MLPEAGDHRVLSAAAAAQQKGFAHIVLLGDPDAIAADAARIGVSLDGVTVVDPKSDPRLGGYVDALVEARRKKGLSREQAEDVLEDENYFATMMVRQGDADGLVSGAAHTTAATVRPGMQARPRVLPERAHDGVHAECVASERWARGAGAEGQQHAPRLERVLHVPP